MLRVEINGSTVIIKTTLNRNGVPFCVLKSKVAVKHKLGVAGFVCPVDRRNGVGEYGIVRVSHPNLDRHRSARIGVGHFDTDKYRVYASGMSTQLIGGVENSTIGVRNGKGERYGLPLGASTYRDDVLKCGTFNTSAVIVFNIAIQRLGGESVTLSERNLIPCVMIEVIIGVRAVGEIGRIHRERLSIVWIWKRAGNRCCGRICRHIQRTSDGIVHSINVFVGIRTVAENSVIVNLVLCFRTDVHTIGESCLYTLHRIDGLVDNHAAICVVRCTLCTVELGCQVERASRYGSGCVGIGVGDLNLDWVILVDTALEGNRIHQLVCHQIMLGHCHVNVNGEGVSHTVAGLGLSLHPVNNGII